MAEVSSISKQDLETWFTYHEPTVEDGMRYKTLRDVAKALAMAILENTPPGADQAAAIRKVREAVMTANAAIACNGAATS